MSRLAVHIRIANLDPSNEEVISRQQAIAVLAADWRKLDDLDKVIMKAGDIAVALGGDGNPGAGLGEEVERAIQKAAPAYLYRERPLDVGVCAGLAALALVTAEGNHADNSHHDIFAAVLWSALAYQPVLGDKRREALRVELQEACNKRCSAAAESARERLEVEEFDEGLAAEGGADTIEEVKAAAAEAIAALKHNANLDREELDVLWWALLNRSRLLKKALQSIQESIRLLACAIECSQFLSALPAEVHRDLVLRTLDTDPALSHKDLLKQVGSDRDLLGGVFGEVEIVERVPAAFPLLYSLKMGKATGDGAAVVRLSSEWASRALLEAAIAQLYAMGLDES